MEIERGRLREGEREKDRTGEREIERGRKGKGGDLQSLQRPVHGLWLHLAQKLYSGCHTLHADTHTEDITLILLARWTRSHMAARPKKSFEPVLSL